MADAPCIDESSAVGRVLPRLELCLKMGTLFGGFHEVLGDSPMLSRPLGDSTGRS